MATRVGLQSFSPLLFGGVRHSAAALVLLTLVRLRRLPLPARALWPPLLALGLLFALSNAAGNWSQQRIPSGTASVLFSTMPLFAVLAARLWLPQERLSWGKVAGIALGVLGTTLMMNGELHIMGDPAGQAAQLLSAAVAAVGVIWSKRLLADVHPLTYTASQMVVAGPILLAAGLWLEPRPQAVPAHALAGLAYLVLAASCFAFLAYYWLMQRMPALTMSLLTYITPPIALLLGVLVLGEQLGALMLAGMLAILAGIVIAQRAR